MIESITLHAIALILHLLALLAALMVGIYTERRDAKPLVSALVIGGGAFVIAYILQVLA